VILNDTMFADVDPVLEAKLVGHFTFRTFAKAHREKELLGKLFRRNFYSLKSTDREMTVVAEKTTYYYCRPRFFDKCKIPWFVFDTKIQNQWEGFTL